MFTGNIRRHCLRCTRLNTYPLSRTLWRTYCTDLRPDNALLMGRRAVCVPAQVGARTQSVLLTHASPPLQSHWGECTCTPVATAENHLRSFYNTYKRKTLLTCSYRHDRNRTPLILNIYTRVNEHSSTVNLSGRAVRPSYQESRIPNSQSAVLQYGCTRICRISIWRCGVVEPGNVWA
jgi:hypothetical protein